MTCKRCFWPTDRQYKDMETLSIIFLAVGAVISFTIGRAFKHFRDKRREKRAQDAAAQALRNQPAEAASQNRSKRKRQLQQLEKKDRTH